MVYEMKLDPKPFELIKSGKKTVELRLNDEKRQKMDEGDYILFTNNADKNEKIAVSVKHLHRYPSFSELFAVIEPERCGYAQGTSNKKAVNEMRKYYSEEQELYYGVIGIEVVITNLDFVISLLKRKNDEESKEQPKGFKYKAIESIATCFDKHKIDYFVKKKENEEEIITEISITKGPSILLHYYCYLRDHDATMTATLITGVPDDKRAAVLEACNDVQNGFCPFTFYIDFDNNLNMNYEFLFAFPKESIGNIAYEVRGLASSILYLLYPDLMEALNNDNYKSAGLDETLRSIRTIVKKIQKKEKE